MINKNYPSGTILYRRDVDVYAVVVSQSKVEEYLEALKFTEEQISAFWQRKGYGENTILFNPTMANSPIKRVLSQ